MLVAVDITLHCIVGFFKAALDNMLANHRSQSAESMEDPVLHG